MAMEIITGSSGAGKSYTVYQELIRESVRHPDRNYAVIVPEQFTMQTQKDLVRMHPNHGLLNLDVLSFNRLAYRVFSETGGNREPVLEDIGKAMVLRRVISGNRKNLEVLGRTLDRRGSVDQMKSLISELLQYRIPPEELGNISVDEGSLLSGKLREIRMIYQGFLDFLEERYLTAEEVPERLARVVGKSEKLRNTEIVFDGFTGFTPVQKEVVRELMRTCPMVRIIITCDARMDVTAMTPPQSLFHMSSRMAADSLGMAREAGCEILPVRRISGLEQGRFSGNPALAFLEQNLFRYGVSCFPEDTGAVRLFRAPDPAGETAYIVSEISRLVRRDGYRYRDIAIVTGNLEDYGREAARQMEAAGIPYFLDQKRSILLNPFVELIRSAVDMIVRGFSYEGVFRFLRSGMTGFLPEETDRMENYVLAVGIRGWRQYQNKWTRCSRRIREEELPELNRLREKFVSLVSDFTEGMRKRGSTLRDRTETLYYLAVRCRAEEQLQEMQDRFQEAGEHVLERECGQVYGIVMDLFDRMTEILGGEKMGISLYQEILEAGLSECSIGLIPPGEDQVMVGDIERTRLKHIKILFFAGVNDGVIPKASSGPGILSENDRIFLEGRQIRLAPDSRTEMYQQRFYLYLMMTKPKNRLYLSYADTDKSGGGLLPSYLIGTIRKLFPGCAIRNTDEAPPEHRMETKAGRMEVLLEGIRDIREKKPSGTLLELAAHASFELPPYHSLMADILYHNPEGRLGEEGALRLYGGSLYHSATRLEVFAGCPFRHFAQYGLGLSEREVYEFLPADLGTVMHAALERFTRNLASGHMDWRELDDRKRNRMADEALDMVVRDYGNAILQSSSRNAYRIEQMRRVLKRTVWAVQEQIRMGDFTPAGAEIAFRDGALKEYQIGGSAMRITGKIDRVDLCRDGDTTYVRVVDYKTGAKKFDLQQLYYGLQLQLMIYLDAAQKETAFRSGSRTQAGGVYYYQIRDPFLDHMPQSETEEREAVLKELRLDGVSRKEPEILRHIDHGLAQPLTDSGVVKVKLKKDGMPDSNAQVASGPSLEILQKYADRKTRELGMRILDGEVRADPYMLPGGGTPCQYCPYKPVCRFDERIPGYRYRKLQKMSAEDILEKMKEEIDTGKDPGKESYE